MSKLEAHILNTLKANKKLMTSAMNALIGPHSTKERNPLRSQLKEHLKRATRVNLSLAQLKERIP